MSHDGVVTLVLAGRERWYEARLSAMNTARGSTWIELSLNIPGWPKRVAWADETFDVGCDLVAKHLSARCRCSMRNDAGSFALFQAALDPHEAKRRAIQLEQRHTWGRLWDIDCYGPRGKVARRELGFTERRCLGCDSPHDHCIGRDAHPRAFIRRRAATIAALAPRLRQP